MKQKGFKVTAPVNMKPERLCWRTNGANPKNFRVLGFNRVPGLQGSKGSRVPKFPKLQGSSSRVSGFTVSRVPGSSVPALTGFKVPRSQGWVPGFQGCRVPGLFEASRVPGFQSFKAPGLERFQGSRVPVLQGFRILGSAVGRGTTPRPRE